ncbi:hypothetical protein K9L05_02770 [Candidatus Babeliales bacterium]|nr:hypothetical protein [Candidatus Babeliales bacterium]MCF7899549.1 hypothetical protein [Candidatus Babeliales bacterium]
MKENLNLTPGFKFFLILIFLSFIALCFTAKLSITGSIQSTLLVWSFYILCFPANHGKIFLGVPFKFITKKTLYYPQIFLWSSAAILNIFTYFFSPWVYFNTLITHLLFQIIYSPWPGWLIIFISFLGTFYKFFVGYQNFNKYLSHKIIRILIICLSLFTLIYFSHKDLIIILNIRA